MERVIARGKIPSRASQRLQAEVVAFLGEVTVAGALREREALTDIDDPSWDALVIARRELATALPEERRAICEAMSEPTRRRVALIILDRDFLQAVARRAVERGRGAGNEP